MGFRYLSVAVSVICLVMDITAAHKGPDKGASKGGGASKGCSSKGGASKGCSSKGGASKGGASKGGASKGGGSKGEEEAICEPGCSNGGVCVGPNTCECAGTGYDGSRCEKAICDLGCSNGGLCVAPNECECTGTGYEGSRCTTAICEPECSNGGSCIAPNTCQCPATYLGPRCESAYCLHGGVYSSPNTCDCKLTGYEGSRCETEPVFPFNVCVDAEIQQEGQITTPNYPNNYPSVQSCSATITAGTGQVVKLTFLDFVLEDSDCDFDYLALSDGDSLFDAPLGTFCGRTSPGEIVSTGQSLTLVFESDDEDSFKGFKADINFIQGN